METATKEISDPQEALAAIRRIMVMLRAKNLDIPWGALYNSFNFIGQFVTILSVNKTRDFLMGALRSFFVNG